MAKKSISAIETGAGFFQGLVTGLMDVTRELNVPFEALYRLATPAGRKTLSKIVSVAYEDWLTEQPVGVSSAPETVTVPDLPVAELIALAEQSFKDAGIPLTYLNPDYSGWDFLLNERGKTFRVFTNTFTKDWEADDARAWQEDIGADGNTAAFIAWVIARKPTGYFVSIPNDDSPLCRDSDGRLCVPYFRRDADHRRLLLNDVRHGWHRDYSVVAFRAI